MGLRGRIFVGPWSKFTECHRARDALTKSGLSFTSVKGDVGKPVVVTIGDKKLEGFDAKQGGPKLAAALKEAGYSAAADKVIHIGRACAALECESTYFQRQVAVPRACNQLD